MKILNFFLFLILLLILPTSILASKIYEGYENFFASFPNTLFNNNQKHKLELYALYPDPKSRFYWEGKHHSVDINPFDSGSVLTIDGQKLKLHSARIFPGEFKDHGNDLNDVDVYFSKNYACLGGVISSTSGVGDRYQQIYLIDMTHKPYQMFKLPSLFNSCTGIRINSKKEIIFYDIDYWYNKNSEFASGVIFTEYKIKNKNFMPTGTKLVATFVEPPDNVWKFIFNSRNDYNFIFSPDQHVWQAIPKNK